MAPDPVPGPAAPGAVPPGLVPSPWLVRHVESETGDTVTLTVEPAREDGYGRFRPGQFNMLYAFGVGEIAISISSDPSRPGQLTHTVRSVGAVSRAITGLRAGSPIGLRGPYGSGWPMEEAEGKDIVVVAGGLGLAPLRPVIYALIERRERYGRVEVIYGARSPKELLYYPEIQLWRARPDLRFQTTVDAAGREWYGDVGLVTARLPEARFDPERTVAMLCGPEIMMRLTAQALEGRSLPTSSIWVSMERNMKCAVGLCGHCQLGPEFVCRDGPVFNWSKLKPYLAVREL